MATTLYVPSPRLDLKGQPIAQITVKAPMKPDPAIDDAFPMRAPGNPMKVHPYFASESGGVHEAVTIREVAFMKNEVPPVVGILEKEAGKPISREKTQVVLAGLKNSVKNEMSRLIRGEKLLVPRMTVRVIKDDEVSTHEAALIGQYGAFIDNKLPSSAQHTLSNGRIIGIYAGAVLEEGIDPEFSDFSARGSTQYDMNVRSNMTMTAHGFANSVAFVNTALKAGTTLEELHYDEDRINAHFVGFRLTMTDKDGKQRHQNIAALVAEDRLYNPKFNKSGEVRVSYGPDYAEFRNPHEVSVKPEPPDTPPSSDLPSSETAPS